MKILYLTLEPPLDPDLRVRGNALRARQLISALTHRGEEVVHVWPAPYDESPVEADPRMYRNRDELAELVASEAPDLILAGYWTQVLDLPDSNSVPVVVDFIAPRPLEVLYEGPERRDAELHRLLEALARARGFVVANRRQEHLLVGYLLMAGHDLRSRVPIARVPIAPVSPLPEAAREPGAWITFVGGGVEWPWRRHRSWLDAAADEVRGQKSARLVEFGGEYPRIVERPGGRLEIPAGEPVCRVDLTSYSQYSRFLSRHAHVGLELADRNVERYFSQSFRVVDYLSHGLPVICNRYLSIADEIERYDAGWTVKDPRELQRTIAGIVETPGAWRAKSGNALRLTRETLDADAVVEPLGKLIGELAVESSTAASTEGAFSALPDAEREELRRLRSEARDWVEKDSDYQQAIADLRWQVAELHDRNHRLSLQASEARPSSRRVVRHLVRDALGKLPKPGDRGEPGNVVVVTRSDLFPTDHGGAVKIVETARALSRRGRDVGIVSDRRDVWWHFRDGQFRTRRFPRWLGVVTLPPGIGALYDHSPDLPSSDAFLYRPLSDFGYVWRALHVARKLQANVYQAEFPAFALPCFRVRSVRGGRVVVVEHNVEYQRLREQDPGLTGDQYEFLKEIEVGFCNQADAVICVSENDRGRLADAGVAERLLHYIPHGVDLGRFRTAVPRDLRRELNWRSEVRILVYHGTFEYPPNLEAVKVCAREVLPRLGKRGLEVRLLAVGRQGPAEPIHPAVHFAGGVESVSEWLKSAEVAVVPLMSGGGTRMKIIDYFASGVPVVSTSKGIEGIPVESGREAFIADDWDIFCDRVEQLLTDAARRKEMVDAARAFVEPLDWNEIATRYLEVFEKA